MTGADRNKDAACLVSIMVYWGCYFLPKGAVQRYFKEGAAAVVGKEAPGVSNSPLGQVGTSGGARYQESRSKDGTCL